jgi:hypothetical protein
MSANFWLFLITGILRSLLFSTFFYLQNGAKKWYIWVIINRCLEVTSLVYRGGRKPGLRTVTLACAKPGLQKPSGGEALQQRQALLGVQA